MFALLNVGLGLLCNAAHAAAEINVVGLFPGKAVLVVDGGAPKTYAVGSSLGVGAKLVATDSTTATVEVNGKRQVLTIGQYVHRSAASSGATVVLQADPRGHFLTRGQVNGGSTVEMLVDTGATLVALPASEALRLGINYKNGRRGYANTANGVTTVYLIKLDTLKVGDMVLNQVDASLQEGGLPITLLGNSFLNRMDMHRDGDTMTLTKRF
jgi:aspartyl protease family protein